MDHPAMHAKGVSLSALVSPLQAELRLEQVVAQGRVEGPRGLRPALLLHRLVQRDGRYQIVHARTGLFKASRGQAGIIFGMDGAGARDRVTTGGRNNSDLVFRIHPTV